MIKAGFGSECLRCGVPITGVVEKPEDGKPIVPMDVVKAIGDRRGRSLRFDQNVPALCSDQTITHRIDIQGEVPLLTGMYRVPAEKAIHII